MGTNNFAGISGLIFFKSSWTAGGHFPITKTQPCPNTCLTKTEGYDHILRFEIKKNFGLNPQCDATTLQFQQANTYSLNIWKISFNVIAICSLHRATISPPMSDAIPKTIGHEKSNSRRPAKCHLNRCSKTGLLLEDIVSRQNPSKKLFKSRPSASTFFLEKIS